MELENGYRVGDFRVVRHLGAGGQGTTYEARHVETDEPVALKVLSMASVEGWKGIELFEREAKTLSSIDHPNVPHYVDYIADDDQFVLVQELIAGRSLADAVADGFRADIDELRRIATVLLEVLTYLHELAPPVIHRDIKPHNVIRAVDGRITLVDFGAVMNAAQTKTHASTMVGTYGYMSPEQYHGQADARSDLYSLGSMLVFLATGREPNELPRKRLKVDFRAVTELPHDFALWLDRLVEPAPEDRFPSARAALESLPARRAAPAPGSALPVPGPALPAPGPALPAPGPAPPASVESFPDPPEGSKIAIEHDAPRLQIDLASSNAYAGLPTIAFGVVTLAIACLWAIFATPISLLWIFWGLFLLLGFLLIYEGLFLSFGMKRLRFDGDVLQVAHELFGRTFRKVGPVRIESAKVEKQTVPGTWDTEDRVRRTLELRGEGKPYSIGAPYSYFELHWLEDAVRLQLSGAASREFVLDLDGSDRHNSSDSQDSVVIAEEAVAVERAGE